MEQNIESPFTPSICNYCDDSPNPKKNNSQLEQLKKNNLNNIFNEPSSIDKNQIPNVSSSLIKTPNKNSNSQSKNLNNYNSISISYQYSNSGQKSNSFKYQINNKKENFIIQKNENINIGVNENIHYNKFENEELSAFSFEIKPQKITPRNYTPENLLFKNESVPEENFIPHQVIKEEKEIKYIKVNNEFKLIPLSNKAISSSNLLQKTKSNTYEIIKKNKNLKKNNSTNIKLKTSIPIFQKNLINYIDIRKKDINNNNRKRKNKNKNNSNSNISRTTNSNYKSKTKNIFPKQEKKKNFKPNSKKDINNIIQRHFQQFYLSSNQVNKRNTKKKSSQNSREKIKYNIPITSLTTYINKISKNNNFTLQKERKVKSLNYNRKNYTLKQENKLFFNTFNSNSKGKNSKQKIKSNVNLSTILNNFPLNDMNKKNNNKSINCLNCIFINLKKNLPNYKSNQNLNIIEKHCHEKEEKIFLSKTKISPGEISYNSGIKTFHTQDTVYTTKENNINTNGTNTINNTNNNIPIMRKPSPTIIKDFSFYKKKQVYKSNLISLVDNKENTQSDNYYLTNNSNNIQSKQYYNKYINYESKKPIASIKLKRLNGDIYSNI